MKELRLLYPGISVRKVLLCVLLLYSLLHVSHQQDGVSREQFSRLLPTNSAKPSRVASHNPGIHPGKVEESNNQYSEEYFYDDEYETEIESKEIIPSDGKEHLGNESHVAHEKENLRSRQDPIASQYDSYYDSHYDSYVDYDTDSNSKNSSNATGTHAKFETEETDHLEYDNSSPATADEKSKIEAELQSLSNSSKEELSLPPIAKEIEEKIPNDSRNQSLDSSILIGEAVVSVVTTKSVVNGTISIPVTESPVATTDEVLPSPTAAVTSVTTERIPSTTDDSRVVASVQTSRSISGARFLPFPAVVDHIAHSNNEQTPSSEPPTESIIDKLDRVQSELSSGFLTSGFRTAGNSLQLDVPGERSRPATTRKSYTTTGKTPVISKFVPRRYNDKRLDYTSKTTTTTTTTTTSTTTTTEFPADKEMETREEEEKETPLRLGSFRPSGTTSRSVRPTYRPKTKVTVEDVSAFLPPGYKLRFSDLRTTTESTSTTSTTTTTMKPTKGKIAVQDISAFLPPNFKLKKEDSEVTEKSLLSDILAKSQVNVSSLLPPDYIEKKVEPSSTPNAGSKEKGTTMPSIEATSSKSLLDLFAKSQVDISALLPKDFSQDNKPEEDQLKPESETPAKTTTTPSTTTKGLKLVFPSRPGGRKPTHKVTTTQSPRGDGPGVVSPKIQKGWPTRATTEFTGWPTPSTTPISIEQLLEAARTATIASVNTSSTPIASLSSTTSTTTTTTTTPRPTTPGICEEECEVAGTIRIVGNATWVPELLDRNTYEWQQLADDIEKEMNLVFSKSTVLRKWYKKIRIDSFSPGSVLVDYFVELTDLSKRVNTQELKTLFHESLRTYEVNQNNSAGSVAPKKLGKFTIDPKFTDFVVIPKVDAPQHIEADDRLIPQWAIAVIVIGVGGLLFIIVFGVSVLVNRQNVSKLKPSISTIYDEQTAKNIIHGTHSSSVHRSTEYQKPDTIWNDGNVGWSDKSFESTSNKHLMDGPISDDKRYNMYDSWRSEWNGYYYNPSHSSSKFAGYDSTTNLSSRHHPDYDTNF